MAQRVGRGIALLFHDRDTRSEWVVSSTPRPHFTPGKDPVHVLQEAGWAPGPVWTGGKSRPHRDSIPERPPRSQSLYQLSYPANVTTEGTQKFKEGLTVKLRKWSLFKSRQPHAPRIMQLWRYGRYGTKSEYSVLMVKYIRVYQGFSGPGSSVGIPTDYGLEGPGSNPGGDEIFCLSRPALGPTQPPVQWVPSLSRG